MATIIDGKAISLTIKNQVKIKAEQFEKTYNRKITLAVIMVGDDPASKIYVNNKILACKYVGFKSLSIHLDENTSQKEINKVVMNLANDDSVDGILVQLPLPDGINKNEVLSLIPANKDVDGFSVENFGRLTIGERGIVPCTPLGVMHLLETINVDLTGLNAVIIGRSNIVGKPMASLLLRANCTVTVCHSKTKNLADICKNADILVSCVGKPKLVTSDMVKKGAIVIDVGINRVDGKLCGDVDFDEVSKIASYITPVPGGVGPMTISMLMKNTCTCAYRRESNG